MEAMRDVRTKLVMLLLLAVYMGCGALGLVIPRNAEVRVRVFSLQPDIWAKPRDDVFLRFNLSLQQTASSLAEMTLCHRVFQTALTKHQVLFSYTTADNLSSALTMHIIGDTHYFMFNKKPQKLIENIKVPITLRIWRHYCHVLANGNYTIYVDGELQATGPIEVENKVLLLNGTLIIGQKQGLSRRFNSQQILKGYTTQFNIWSYGLGKEDVANMANCARQRYGDIFSSDRDDVELINAEESEMLLSKLCSVDEKFIVFPGVRNFKEAKYMCTLIGSELYGPLGKKDVTDINNTLTRQDVCREKKYLWLGLTDEETEGIWRRISDNKIAKDIMWFTGQPDKTREENCIKAHRNSLLSKDVSCNDPTENACALCIESPMLQLNLRGLCMKSKHETMFEVRGYYERKPYFHGFYGLMIFKEADTQWVLFDTTSNETVASVDIPTTRLYPLGRREWVLEVSKCENAAGTRVNLSFSACGENDYVCANGQCIDMDGRCDAKDDCDDETDEIGCHHLGFPIGYRLDKPPKNELNATEALEPEVEFQIIRFLDINDVLQVTHLEFVLQLAWRETRLNYYNLDQDMYINRIPSNTLQLIWRPALKFPNIKGGNLKMIEENLFIKKLGDPLPADFNAMRMNQIYNGSSAELVSSRRYNGIFNCRFDVFYYPLDRQECSVLVQMASVNKEVVRFTTNKSQVKIEQKFDISTYIVDRFVATSPQNGHRESLLQVYFVVTRRYLLIMLSVFLPSGMLCAVGYCTLFVKLEKLDVRLGVSLTTLLVLYTFFSQTSSSLPKTAYVKMIDVWFFFCTFLLFFIIIIHVVVEVLDDGKVVLVAPRGKKLRRSKMLANSVLVFTRLAVVPLAVLAFSLVYWTKMLL